MANIFDRYEELQPDPEHGGYSDMRLWPFYMAYSGGILLLSPVIGGFLSFLVITVPSILAISHIAKRQNCNPETVARMYKEIDELYASIEKKEKQTKASKPQLATVKQTKQTKATTIKTLAHAS